MTEQKKMWDLPEPEPARHRRGQSPRRGKPGPATDSGDTGGDNVRVDPIAEMVGALVDPLIVFPSGWEETLPEELRKRLPLDRLLHNMMCNQGKARWDEACDLEALLYMYPLCMARPLGEKWTRIYLYLGTRVMGKKIPDDIRRDSLDQYDMEALRDLKQWIQKKKLQARRDRRRGQKAEAVVPVEMDQPKMF
ncbi:hypothetical protein LCGC14_1157660 [marine sediment metagenome]|uniref:Uncharacterized protein n=1 Tax=marine sediment metagenome TaxID=412755 RepID=A0A0F9PBV8_9ZZZZ